MKAKAKPTRKDLLLQVRCDDEFLAALDDWRRQQDDIPSRAEAVRRLVARGLDSARQSARR